MVFVFSCQEQNNQNTSQKIDSEQLHYLEKLSDEHPNKNQMESFLIHYKESFLPIRVYSIKGKYASLIQSQYAFRTEKTNIIVHLVFCKNQQDCLKIAEASSLSQSEKDKTRWLVNGAVLIVIYGKEKHEINDLATWFAGEE